MSRDDDDDDKGGYGRPPKSRRFRKGQSGNPKGRPPRSRNLKKIIETELDRMIPGVGEHGKGLSVREMMVRGMIAKATKGSVAAAEWLVENGPKEGGFMDGFF